MGQAQPRRLALTALQMRVHLDTNVLIRSALAEDGVRAQLRRWAEAEFVVSAMAWAEFCSGPVSAAALGAWRSALRDIVPVDQAISEASAVLFNATGRRSRSLPDCIIAATAIRDGSPLATLNREDFDPFVALGLALA